MQKREKQKEPANVEDVWKRGYGDGIEITWLFLGLARAAGFWIAGALTAARLEETWGRRDSNPDVLSDRGF